MAGISFSEVEVKRLILALAGSKAPVEESPEHEADPKDGSEDKAEGEDSSGKPHGESTKAMLERKLKGK